MSASEVYRQQVSSARNRVEVVNAQLTQARRDLQDLGVIQTGLSTHLVEFEEDLSQRRLKLGKISDANFQSVSATRYVESMSQELQGNPPAIVSSSLQQAMKRVSSQIRETSLQVDELTRLQVIAKSDQDEAEAQLRRAIIEES